MATKGIDLSMRLHQHYVAPWRAEDATKRIFVSLEGHRIRREKLACELGGAWHDYEDRGRDFANHGLAGIVEVDVRVCVQCGRDKR